MSRSQSLAKSHKEIWVKKDKAFLTKPGAIHVWKANLSASDEELNSYWSLLSKEEQVRAQRFYFKKDKYHFLKSRGILKILLSNYLDLNPESIIFEYTKFGKPFLKNTNLQFNVSHAAGRGLFAFTFDSLIGVDIEKIKTEIEFKNLVNRFFSKNEAAIILGLKCQDQAKAFFKCWTRKEAFIKAHGEGLSIPLDCFEVSILDSETLRLKTVDWQQETAKDWSLASFEPYENWLGAIAVKGEIQKVNYFEFEKNKNI